MDLGSCRRIGFNFGGKSLVVVVVVSEMVSGLQQERIIHYFMILLDRGHKTDNDRGGWIKFQTRR